MSFFSDIFYPGNPERRNQVVELQHAIKEDFSSYRYAWNKMAGLLNDALAEADSPTFRGIQVMKLSKDIEYDDPNACAKEINTAIEDFRKKFEVIADEIKLPADWANSVSFDNDSLRIDVEQMKKFTSGFTLGLGVTLTTVVILFAIASTATLFTGIALGVVAGALAFLALDMIMGAVLGAMERRKLEEVIFNLKEMRKSTRKLSAAAVDINTVCQAIERIKKGFPYAIDSEHMLRWNRSKNVYEVINIDTLEVVCSMAA